MRSAQRSRKKARARRPPPGAGGFYMAETAPCSHCGVTVTVRSLTDGLCRGCHAFAARGELVDRQRGERSEQVARHTRETAELLSRHVDEDRKLEHRHQIEMGRLRESQRPDVARPWVDHQAERGPRT